MLLAAVAAVRISTRAGLPSLLLYLAIGLAVGEAGLGVRVRGRRPHPDPRHARAGGDPRRGRLHHRLAGGPTGRAAGRAARHPRRRGQRRRDHRRWSTWSLDVDLRTAILLGAVASSTDAAAVFAVLRRMPIRARLRATRRGRVGLQRPAGDHPGHRRDVERLGRRRRRSAILGLVVYQLVVGVAVGVAVARAGSVGAGPQRAAGLRPLSDRHPGDRVPRLRGGRASSGPAR